MNLQNLGQEYVAGTQLLMERIEALTSELAVTVSIQKQKDLVYRINVLEKMCRAAKSTARYLITYYD